MAFTEKQFKERFAELGEYSKKEADLFFDVFDELVKEIVGNAEKAKIPGIGTINCTVREARTARNPATGGKVKVPAKVGVRLSLAKAVKDAVPSIKKGRRLLEEREAAKAKTTRKKNKVNAKATSSKGKKRGPGRPKGTVNKKKSKV